MILPADSIDLSRYDQADLLRLRDRINKLLPSSELKSLDLSSELVQQFLTAKAIMAKAQEDDAPVNQMAQTINTTAAIIKQLVELQKSAYAIEEQKKVEEALASALKQFPAVQQAFKEALLAAAGDQ